MTPKRIQRRRTKGWRLPIGAVSVTRPGRWGNPYAIGKPYLTQGARTYYVQSAQQAVDLFRTYVERRPSWWQHQIIELLRGRDLACWCPLDQPCHADVLLEIANA